MLVAKMAQFFHQTAGLFAVDFFTTFRLVISTTVKSQVFRKLKKQRKLVSAVVVLEAV